MQVNAFIEKKIPYIIIDDFLTDEELKDVWRELDFLHGKLLPPEHTKAATGLNDEPVKSNKGAFLTDLYCNARYLSNYLKYYRKYATPKLLTNLANLNYAFTFLSNITEDNTLISYYGNNDYYEPHRDGSIWTQIFWCYKEPKQFTGGDFILTEIEEKIEVKNNRMILIPSHAEHAVEAIKMESNEGNCGRYAFSTFYINR